MHILHYCFFFSYFCRNGFDEKWVRGFVYCLFYLRVLTNYLFFFFDETIFWNFEMKWILGDEGKCICCPFFHLGMFTNVLLLFFVGSAAVLDNWTYEPLIGGHMSNWTIHMSKLDIENAQHWSAVSVFVVISFRNVC